jgi:hypothetical protein
VEGLGVCAESVAQSWSVGLALLTFVIAAIVVALRRTLTSFAYALVWVGGVYLLARLILPHGVIFLIVASFGIASGICEGHWDRPEAATPAPAPTAPQPAP